MISSVRSSWRSGQLVGSVEDREAEGEHRKKGEETNPDKRYRKGTNQIQPPLLMQRPAWFLRGHPYSSLVFVE
jgi:hypothetical protein